MKLKRRGVNTSYRKYIYKRARGRCTYCLVKLTHRTNWWPGGGRLTDFQIDHVVPVSRGGMDDVPNMRAVCTACNRMKASKTPGEWILYLRRLQLPFAERVQRVVKLHIGGLYKPGQEHLYKGEYEKYIRQSIHQSKQVR